VVLPWKWVAGAVSGDNGRNYDLNSLGSIQSSQIPAEEEKGRC